LYLVIKFQRGIIPSFSQTFADSNDMFMSPSSSGTYAVGVRVEIGPREKALARINKILDLSLSDTLLLQKVQH
jgi:hypothetical protein